ncbi:MAG: hypothetical protein A3F09_05810 [Chlamydiae bacterium RIFCSPHIGHO2_12_FULL_49_11]|nr:MAG: hypothetical protein A3F09_05810 [Chlamydiae bacterium RIFCSPHIGHO2_12_FULL_49_11]
METAKNIGTWMLSWVGYPVSPKPIDTQGKTSSPEEVSLRCLIFVKDHLSDNGKIVNRLVRRRVRVQNDKDAEERFCNNVNVISTGVTVAGYLALPLLPVGVAVTSGTIIYRAAQSKTVQGVCSKIASVFGYQPNPSEIDTEGTTFTPLETSKRVREILRTHSSIKDSKETANTERTSPANGGKTDAENTEKASPANNTKTDDVSPSKHQEAKGKPKNLMMELLRYQRNKQLAKEAANVQFYLFGARAVVATVISGPAGPITMISGRLFDYSITSLEEYTGGKSVIGTIAKEALNVYGFISDPADFITRSTMANITDLALNGLEVQDPRLRVVAHSVTDLAAQSLKKQFENETNDLKNELGKLPSRILGRLPSNIASGITDASQAIVDSKPGQIASKALSVIPTTLVSNVMRNVALRDKVFNDDRDSFIPGSVRVGNVEIPSYVCTLVLGMAAGFVHRIVDDINKVRLRKDDYNKLKKEKESSSSEDRLPLPLPYDPPRFIEDGNNQNSLINPA